MLRHKAMQGEGVYRDMSAEGGGGRSFSPYEGPGPLRRRAASSENVTWMQAPVPAPPLAGWVTLGKLLNLPEPHSSHWESHYLISQA